MLEHNTITLTDSDREVINSNMDSGEFSTPAEVVRAGLLLLEERQKKIEVLRAALKEGENSGFIENFSFDDFLKKMREEREILNA